MPQAAFELHPEEFTIPLPLGQEGMPHGVEAQIGCIDPNATASTDDVLGDRIYLQLPGGGVGLGNIALLAKEIQEPGFTKKTGTTADGFGKIAGQALLSERGYEAVIHDPCAFINNGEAVNRSIAENASGSVLAMAAIFEPSTPTLETDRIVQGASRLLEHAGIAPPETVYEDMTKDSNGFPGLHSAHLHRTDKPVRGFVVIHEDGMAFDVQSANDADSRYYVATRQALTVASEVVQAYLNVDRDIFMAAAGAVLSATHTVLEEKTGQDLPVYTIGEAA